MNAMDQRYGREGRGREPREGDLRRQRLGTDPLDQRVDRWVTAGRQFVEGVAGSRPSGRPAPRAGDRRPGRRPRFDDLGRWVEDRLDWLLEDGDDWREPWQEEERGAPLPPAPVRSRRQGLEAVSRRGRSAAGAPQSPAPRSAPFDGPEGPSGDAPAGDDDWPDDTSFSLPRWQRPERDAPPTQAPAGESAPALRPGAALGSRPLPRSSRRRS